MKFIGSLETTGGPVLFTAADLAGDWDGTAGDYWALIEELPPSRVSTYVSKSGIRVGVFVTEAGNCSVFASREEILLVEVAWAPEDFVLESAMLDFSDVAMEPDALSLAGFGGRVVLFDSTLAGDSLNLQPGAVSRSAPLEEGRVAANTAVIDVNRGTWTASTFAYEDDEVGVRLQGAVFMLAEDAAEDQ